MFFSISYTIYSIIVRSTLITYGTSYYSLYPIKPFIYYNFRMINQILKEISMSNTTVVGS